MKLRDEREVITCVNGSERFCARLLVADLAASGANTFGSDLRASVGYVIVSNRNREDIQLSTASL